MGLCPKPQSEPEVPTSPGLGLSLRDKRRTFSSFAKRMKKGKVQGTQFPVGGRAPKAPKEEIYAYRKS